MFNNLCREIIFPYGGKNFILDSVTKDGSVICQASQELQDWLMREFAPGVEWQYWNQPSSISMPLGWERVCVTAEVHTVMALRWA